MASAADIPFGLQHGPESHTVSDVVERLDRLADHGSLSLGDVVRAFGRTSFIPLLMVPAILVVSPLSGIPLFSSICGLSIALVALQWVIGRDHAWLPRRLREQSISEDRVHAALRHVRRLAGRLDAVSRSRFAPLVTGHTAKIPMLLCMLCGLAMPFLELVPFSSSLLGLSVLLFSTGFLTRDGLFAVGGMATMSVAATIPLGLLSLV